MDHGNPTPRRKKRTGKPLDRASLNELAMRYVARFATTSAKLETYLGRKLRERGWEDETPPAIGPLVEDFVERGFVDDAGWARSRAAALSGRGYGSRRIDQALRAAGIDEQVRATNRLAHHAAREAALRLARRRGFGPYGSGYAGEEGRKLREKNLAAMIRAGHDFDHARRVLDSPSESELEAWVAEAQEELER
jgi:regulatory protein